jgi:preprotein translocase subunit SecF
MSKLGQIGTSLYQGKLSIEFVSRWKRWFAISGVIVLVALGALVFRGFNYGIEFKGGVEYNAQFPSGTNLSSLVTPISDAVVGTHIENADNPVVVVSGNQAIRIDVKPLDEGQKNFVAAAIKRASGSTEVNSTVIGPTWGASIAKKALTGLIVFVVLVVLVIWGYFREWRMSVAAMVALVHDLVITIGVYALTGFEVTPATVTGVLTILGYSLYDTVVVFDKVRENTRGIATSTRFTYAEAANLAVNQTLVRSINTSLTALLPVGAILYVGTFSLGSGPLKDLALALFVGMAAGTYSSIFIATPLLAMLKMRDPTMVQQAKRVAHRKTQQAKAPAPVPAEVAVTRPRRPTSPAPTTATAAAPGATTTAVATPSAPDPASEPQEQHEDDEAVVPAATTVRRPLPGRTTPPAARPMSSTAAKRAQPQRQARSKRGKRS